MPKSLLTPQESLQAFAAIEQMTGNRRLFFDNWMSGDLTGVSKDHEDILLQAIEEVVTGKDSASVLDPKNWLAAIKDPSDTGVEIDAAT